LIACWDQAVTAGAEVRFDAPATAVRRVGTGVEVTIGDDVIAARVAVVAAAGWSGDLLEPDVPQSAGARDHGDGRDRRLLPADHRPVAQRRPARCAVGLRARLTGWAREGRSARPTPVRGCPASSRTRCAHRVHLRVERLADLADETLGLRAAESRAFPADRLAGIIGQPHSWR
jgi:hypothetical protein